MGRSRDDVWEDERCERTIVQIHGIVDVHKPAKGIGEFVVRERVDKAVNFHVVAVTIGVDSRLRILQKPTECLFGFPTEVRVGRTPRLRCHLF